MGQFDRFKPVPVAPERAVEATLPQGAEKSRNGNPTPNTSLPAILPEVLDESRNIDLGNAASESQRTARDEESRALINEGVKRNRGILGRTAAGRAILADIRKGPDLPKANPVTYLNQTTTEFPEGEELAPMRPGKPSNPMTLPTAESLAAERAEYEKRSRFMPGLGTEGSDASKDAAKKEMEEEKNKGGYDLEATGIVSETTQEAAERRAAGGSGLLPGYEKEENATTMRWDPDKLSIIHKESGRDYDEKIHGKISSSEQKALYKNGESKRYRLEKGAAVNSGVLPTLPSEAEKRKKQGFPRVARESYRGLYDKAKNPYILKRKNPDTGEEEVLDLTARKEQNDAFSTYEAPKTPAAPEMEEVERTLPETPAETVYRSAKHERLHKMRTAAIAAVHEKHDKIRDAAWDKEGRMSKQLITAAGQQRNAARAADLARVDQAYPEPKEGFFKEIPAKPGETIKTLRPKATDPLPPVEKPEGSPVLDVPSFQEGDSEKSLEQLDAEDKRQRENRSPNVGTTELTQNTLPASAQIKNAGQEHIDDQKMSQSIRAGFVPKTDPDLVSHAAQLAHNHGLTAEDFDLPSITRSREYRQAHLMREAGINPTGSSGEDEKELQKYTGTGPLAEERERAAFHLLKSQERYNAGRKVTYDVSDGMHVTGSQESGVARDPEGKPIIERKEAFFRAPISGEKVSLKDTSHPEHPGPHLVGDESPFAGFSEHPDAGGKPLLAHGDMERGDFIHEGWHPYKDKSGDTVFEKHTVPEGAIHAGDIVRGLLKARKNVTSAISAMGRGESLELDVNGGIAVGGAPVAPIAGVKNPQSHYHADHLISGVLHPACPDCGAIATQASKDRAAEFAAKFKAHADTVANSGQPPLGASGPGTPAQVQVGKQIRTPKTGKISVANKNNNRLLTTAESARPVSSDREGNFIDVSSTSVAAEARKNLGNVNGASAEAARTSYAELKAAREAEQSAAPKPEEE